MLFIHWLQFVFNLLMYFTNILYVIWSILTDIWVYRQINLVHNSFWIGNVHNLKCRLTCRSIYVGIIGKFSLGIAKSQYWGLSLTRDLSRFPMLLFTTLVWLSIWGWYAELNCNLLSNLFHKTLQKWPKNSVSLSLVIVFGTPCNHTTSLKNKCATRIASFVFLQGMKWAILEKRSTTTNIESWLLWVCGSPKTKSMVPLAQVRACIGLYSAVLLLPFGTLYKQKQTCYHLLSSC